MIDLSMPAPMPIVVGVPRSGTTLLRMMLDAHPELAIPPETGFLPALADLDAGTDPREAAWQIISGFHTWPDFALDADVLRKAVQDAPPTAADAARAFYRLYAERFGKPRYGDKTPTYGTDIDRIGSLLPEARFLHIIRDGRDVVSSVRGLWFRPGDSIESCAQDWATRLARTRALGSQLPYLEVRYEQLVVQPADTLHAICRFLELTFDDRMLAFHQTAASRLAEHQARYAADGTLIISKAQRLHNQRFVTQPPRADRIGRWTTELTADECARFESVAGDWLDALGYRRRPERV
jgi:hypothetical protein